MKKEIQNAMPHRVRDRRLLANVPDKPSGRIRPDRRGHRYTVQDELYSPAYIEKVSAMSFRYETNYKVKLICSSEHRPKKVIRACGRNISATGMLLEIPEEMRAIIAVSNEFYLQFQITPGTMPEGYLTRVHTKAVLKRIASNVEKGVLQCAFEFEEPLPRYNARQKDRRAGWTAVASLLVLLLAAGSLCNGTLRYHFAWPFYIYIVVLILYCMIVYLFSAGYEPILIDKTVTPGVTIILSCHNEESSIGDALLSCVNQEYPPEQLEVLIIDNSSTDHSRQVIEVLLKRLYVEGVRFHTQARVRLVCMEKYREDGMPLVTGMARAKHELVLFTDGQSLLDPFAVRNIVQPFRDEQVAAVCGHVMVANTYTNTLTRVQSVYRGLEDRVLRSCQSYFEAVARLAEPLCCCRRELLMGKVSGKDCADGRRLARFLLRHHKIIYQDTAYCTWIAPNSLQNYSAYELAEKRSMVQGLWELPTLWRKEPALGMLGMTWGVLFTAAVPLGIYAIFLMFQGVFPWLIFPLVILGVCILAVSQAVARGSLVWLSGMALKLWYEVLLFWQYPVAWMTYWIRRKDDKQ